VDTEGGHLAEPDSGVGKEGDDEPIGFVGARVVACVRVRVRGVSAGVGEVVDLIVGQIAVLPVAR
jgi:hypothetical protein